jgi:Family of unknown function (DUF6328)
LSSQFPHERDETTEQRDLYVATLLAAALAAALLLAPVAFHRVLFAGLWFAFPLSRRR